MAAASVILRTFDPSSQSLNDLCQVHKGEPNTATLRLTQLSGAATAALVTWIPGEKHPLDVLHITETRFSDVSLNALLITLAKKCDTLCFLLLNKCQITDQQITKFVIPFLKGLTKEGPEFTLSLQGNQIEDAAAVALAEATIGTRVIRIDLSHNQLSDAGAARLAEAVAKNPALMMVHLDSPTMTPEGREAARRKLTASPKTVKHDLPTGAPT